MQNSNVSEVHKGGEYCNLTTEEVFKRFGSGNGGLSESKVEQARHHYGRNKLPEPPKSSPMKIFARQFKDAMLIVLIIAATMSYLANLFSGENSFVEPLLIYAVVLSIAVVGFLNEYKAERTVEALRQLISPICRVRRDGKVNEITVDELVPGDVVLLEEGNKIPADLRLILIRDLRINESSLTGESQAVVKQTGVIKGKPPVADMKNMAFAGTIVATGIAEGVVVTTAGNTQIGSIASLANSMEESETPLQKKLNALGKRLGQLVALIGVVVFILLLVSDQVVQEEPTFINKVLMAFTVAVALSVAAIPEGLAFVVRICLALGARRLAAQNALVRKLVAVEALGSTDVVCTDKTGTLTTGKMTVRQLFCDGKLYELSGVGLDRKGSLTADGQPQQANNELKMMLQIGLLCNNARLKPQGALGDPTEVSLLISAAKLGLASKTILGHFQRIDELPFNSRSRLMKTLHSTSGEGLFIAAKGSPDALLEHCSHVLINGQKQTMTAQLRQRILDQNSAMAANALRVLGFAYFEGRISDSGWKKRKLTFVGLQGMIDPPRKEVAQVINRVQTEAGMKVVMITGDHLETGRAIAKDLGIMGEAIEGAQLDQLSDDQLRDMVGSIGVYARVSPTHKVRIVRALQQAGHQVAMAGDGVNDALAIKAADIGIAMGKSGTDAAKEASDMILLDDRFVTIIKAIEEGRGVYDNVRKFVIFLLSSNIGEVMIVLAGLLLHGNLVLAAVQLLFINIVTDGLPAVALGSDPTAKDVMRHSPLRYQKPIIEARQWFRLSLFGVAVTIVLMFIYRYINESAGAAMASSAVFMALVVCEFIYLFYIRKSFGTRFLSNPMLIITIIGSLVIQALVLYVPFMAHAFGLQPLGVIEWAWILASAGLMLVIIPLINGKAGLSGARPQ